MVAGISPIDAVESEQLVLRSRDSPDHAVENLTCEKAERHTVAAVAQRKQLPRVLAAVLPRPIFSASSTTTRKPREASRCAATHPVIPPAYDDHIRVAAA